ncbi:MAG TPA: DUF438 domain-containing protein [Anaerohalosphaeraceae bacterium]|jgi:DUF438 domain-containing protein|nr:DUF438 domain-containing protein [Anaerohalosphaeraceae bacterium]HRT49354.1 DUF438 domain-containing protein [Anaerohalosphaeraceae bacterium]HRT85917.1 DUF438 domain-containing protein [Anaerohalosphaeraceae bacterium]
MNELPQDSNAEALSRLLRRINQGIDPKLLRKEANQLISRITPDDIATAEQRLVKDGYSARLASQLAAAFVLMGILEGQTLNLKNQLPPSHVLRMVLAEHDMLRCFLADLQEVAERLSSAETVTSTNGDFMKLSHIVEHLNAMEEHIEREEDVIFPYLQKHGWTSLCRAAQSDHGYIKVAIDDLTRIVAAFQPSKAGEFKIRLKSITTYLCPTMIEHLFQEDNILFPMALEVIKDAEVWKRIKDVCDQIGYCGVHT